MRRGTAFRFAINSIARYKERKVVWQFQHFYKCKKVLLAPFLLYNNTSRKRGICSIYYYNLAGNREAAHFVSLWRHCCDDVFFLDFLAKKTFLL